MAKISFYAKERGNGRVTGLILVPISFICICLTTPDFVPAALVAICQNIFLVMHLLAEKLRLRRTFVHLLSFLLFYWSIELALLVFLRFFLMEQLLRRFRAQFSFGESSIISQLSSVAIWTSISGSLESKEGQSFLVQSFGMLASSFLKSQIGSSLIFVFTQCTGFVLNLQSFQSEFDYKTSSVVLWSVACIPAGTMIAYCIDSNKENQKSRNNLSRKTFHFLVFIVFLPFIAVNERLFKYCGVHALFVFLFVEINRHDWNIETLNSFLESFRSNQDNGKYIFSHIFLLLGCLIPVFFPFQTFLGKSCGIVMLGLLDSTASIVGLRFHDYGKKTMVGSIAAISVTSLAYVVYMLFIDSRIDPFIFLVVIACGFLEKISTQNDNLILPLFAALCFSLYEYTLAIK